MQTLLVIDGENAFNSIVREKVSKLKNTQATVVIGKRQNITGIDCEDIEVIRVVVERKNSVDFVVVSVVADKMTTRKYSNAIILSDDTGFDSAVQYLKSAGYRVRRVGYREFIRGKDTKNQQLEKMAVSCCGYINNHLQNGVYKTTFEQHLSELFGHNKNVVTSYLTENKLITLRRDKIYFDTKLLFNVASGEYIL